MGKLINVIEASISSIFDIENHLENSSFEDDDPEHSTTYISRQSCSTVFSSIDSLNTNIKWSEIRNILPTQPVRLLGLGRGSQIRFGRIASGIRIYNYGFPMLPYICQKRQYLRTGNMY